MKFTSNLVQKSGLSDNKVVDTPEVLGVKLKIDDGEVLENPTPFRQLVGVLSYLTITRPDISHIVHTISQFQHRPTSVHMGAAMRIVRYVKNSLNKGDSLISWRCKKQSKVSLSSTEAEYRAMATTNMKLVWLKSLLKDMGVSALNNVKMFCDNKSAIYIASNHTFHERTKHIEMDCHYIREEVLMKKLELAYVPSEFQLGDFFTKSLPSPRFHILIGKLSVFSP
ncbi:unnamed protein product [Victoria cruziana]